MPKSNGNGSSKKENIIKSFVHIEADEPYVKLSFNPGTGSFGFDVKAKTLEEAMQQTSVILDNYSKMMKLPEVKAETFV